MLKRPTIWEAVLMIGATAIISGIVILATDSSAVDHKYGMSLILGGSAFVVTSLIVLFFVLRNAKRDGTKQPVHVESIYQSGGTSNAGNLFVTSIGQTGGQTAASITNVGVQPRTLTDKDTRSVVSALAKFAGTEAQVCSVTLDAESRRFADEITSMLTEAGWKMKPVNSTLLTAERGVVVRCPDATLPDAARECGEYLAGLGFRVLAAADVDIAKGIEILVLTG